MSRGPGVYDDIPEAEYHADRDSLSHSGAKLLLPPSCPAKFKHIMDHGQPHKPQFTFGSLAHKIVLGKGATITEIEAFDYRTKTAQGLRDTALANGEIPALTVELIKAKDMAAAVRRHPVAGPLFDGGAPELSLYANHPSGVPMRGRLDWLTCGENIGLGERPVIADYKTSADANPNDLPRTVAKWNYAMQFAWYITLARLVGIEDPAMLFVFQEKEPPYLVNVIELDGEAFDYGHRQMEHALAIYQDCMETGVWPGYSDTIQSISLPAWAIKSELFEGAL